MNTQSIRLALVAAVVLVLAAAYFLTRPKYGTISDFGYDVTMALESVCSRQDVQRLQTIRQLVSDEQRISQHERQWLDQILKSAESGSWDEARRMARELMRAQVVTESPGSTARVKVHTH